MHDHAHHGHDHEHGHDHGAAPPAVGAPTPHLDPRRALAWSLALNGVFLVVEAVTGFLTGSLALLGDAAHMLSDVGALALALGAAIVARKAADASRTFGWARVEVLGGFVNALTQLAVCAWIVVEAIGRLVEGPPAVPGLPVLVVAFLGLLINLGSAALLFRSDRDNLNIRGALLHMAADALGSVGAMVAAGLVLAGYPAADAVVSLLIAGLVLWGTWGLLRDSARVLLQLPPEGVDVTEVRAVLVATTGVVDVHDLHIWTLDGRAPVLSAHIVVGEAGDLDRVRGDAARILRRRFSIEHTTVQVELAEGDGGEPCGMPPCDGEGGGLSARVTGRAHSHSHGHGHSHGH